MPQELGTPPAEIQGAITSMDRDEAKLEAAAVAGQVAMQMAEEYIQAHGWKYTSLYLHGNLTMRMPHKARVDPVACHAFFMHWHGRGAFTPS